MTVMVSIWKKDNQGGVGHASADVGGEYVSFWPKEGYGAKDAARKGRVTSYANTPQEDINDEGRGPDYQIQLDGLDERAMRHRWRELKREKYSFADLNCSKVVAEVLKAGSGLEPGFTPTAYPGDYLPSGVLSHVIGQVANAYTYATKQHRVWTPESAGRFAQGIADHLEQQRQAAAEAARIEAQRHYEEQLRLEEELRREAEERAYQAELRRQARTQQEIEYNPWAQQSRRNSPTNSSGDESWHTAESHHSNRSHRSDRSSRHAQEESSGRGQRVYRGR